MEKILVTEDHVVNQEFIQEQLDLLGYAVEVASDGLEPQLDALMLRVENYVYQVSSTREAVEGGYDN